MTSLPDCVSFVEAYDHFMSIESPSSNLSDSSTKASQEQLIATILYMKKCIQQRQIDGMLSANERLFELQNAQLYALCVEYYLDILIPKQTFFPASIKRAHACRPTRQHAQRRLPSPIFSRSRCIINEVFGRAESVGLLTETKRREQYERLENNQLSLSRDEKIQGFKLQRELGEKLH
ncbi:hypothetical protein CCR75_008479 [Bremia lactucae]|uniref:Uncharacterized protein n=1 Tax=Bremia lactucae TaxID=4779 RepID=A0A976IIL3_BRELC|nr:hypothetical protein CCR75_004868 [Bremia lactucae]TDH72660.1 hypothetical protein CCR75_008479 [Bremia lactucae]